MKKVGLILILLGLMLAACSAGGANQLGSEESLDVGTVPAAASATEEVPAESEESEASTSGPATDAGDPTQVRERDWKLGNTVDPVVTVVEYGDFQ